MDKKTDIQTEYPYKQFKQYDMTPIAVEIWENKESVEMHCHHHYEFALITKGSCTHTYRGTTLPLIPGDVFIIEPDQPHGYDIQAQVNIINCMFFPELLNYESSQVLKSAKGGDILQDSAGIRKQWEELLQYVTFEETAVESNVRQANLDAQGIIHLNSQELFEAESLMKHMAEEQERKEINMEYAKSAYLQLILVLFSRVQGRRRKLLETHSDQKRDMVYHALVYIEEHLDEKIDFSELAEESYMSLSYFRSIFKDVTGLTPVDYLNRMRIVKSLEYLERDKITISEAAGRVGIFDANYFSRMFKKIMGYSPKYFKSIGK